MARRVERGPQRPSGLSRTRHVPITRAATVTAAVALLVLIALVAYEPLVNLSSGGMLAQIPPPHDTPAQSAIREHITEKYGAAISTPSSAASVGAYCLALHADMFYEAAERCYAVPIELSGGDWQWLYYRSLLRGDLGGGNDLLGDLQAVVEKAPGLAPAWLRLGDAHFKARRHDEAEEAWTRAAELTEPERSAAETVPHVVEIPVASYAWLGLSRIQLARGDVTTAQKILERAITDGPPFSSAFRLLAETYVAEGREADAERALYHARKLPPYAPYGDPMVDALARESRNSIFLLRVASEANLSINGKWSEYLTRRAFEFDPDNPEVVIKLARVLRTLGRNEEALEYFRQYHRKVPDDVQVLAHIGSCLSELGRFDEAEPYLRRAVQALDDGLTHYNLALLLAMTGRLDEAVVEYERALERDPSDVAARSNLAAVLVRLGDLNRAAHELGRVLALDPENAVAHTNLGLVHAQRGEVSRAKRELEEALQLDPSLTHAAEALRSLGGSP